ncbi:MAG: hypothetical protein R3C26_06395 [Calditrichia bacterium]
MALINIAKPAETEYPVYFGKYIEKVNDGNILETLSEQLNDTLAFSKLSRRREHSAMHRKNGAFGRLSVTCSIPNVFLIIAP